MHIVVVGGGIGGTAAALALHRQNIRVTMLEQAAALSEVGAGLQVGANGARVLRQLGVLDAFASRAVHAQSYRIMHFESGEVIHDHPLGSVSAAHYGERAFEAHRADLLDVLVAALPAGVVRTGSRCVGVTQNGTGVAVMLESGEQIHADVVIGADGVHSVVRRGLWGEDQPIFSGTAAWRSLIPAERMEGLAFDERFRGWRGAGRIAIGYWVRSQKLFNFAAFVPAEELRRESWSQRGEHAELKRAMAGCEPALQQLVDRASENFITAMYYRRPLERWTSGRVTLLGDSAHAMLPYMAQGAVQSMEDGFVLAACLAKAERGEMTPQDALLDYEARRRPRTTRVQHNVMALREFWFATDPVKRVGGMRRMQAQDALDPIAESQWGWIYRYDADIEAVTPLDHGPAMPVSRAEHLAVWPRLALTQRWNGLFGFDDLSSGFDGLRLAWNRAFNRPEVGRELTLGGVSCIEWAPRNAGSRVVVHLHAGGFIMGSARSAMSQAALLGEYANARVICVDCRLSPEHAYPAPVDDLRAVYAALLQEGIDAQNVFFSGESSGAAVVLSAAMTLRDSGEPLPRGLVLVSPFADMALSGESLSTNGFSDEFLHRDMLTFMATSYAQQTPCTDPGVSPIYGDLSSLPPILLLAGRHEALCSDAVRIASRADAQGGFARLLLADTATHAFTQFEAEPAREPALRLMARFIAGLHALPLSAKRVPLHSEDHALIGQL